MAKKLPKKSPAWNIAATHYLTSGFAMPILIGLAVDILFGRQNSTIILLAWPVGIAAGVMYSAKYVNKTYKIENVVTISKMTATYNVALYALLIINAAFKPFTDGVSGLVSTYFSAVSAVTWAILATISSLLLYILSNKYLKK